MSSRTRRSAHSQGMWLAFLGSALLLAALIVPLVWDSSARSRLTTVPIYIYCAASQRVPVEAVAEAYEREFGTRVIVDAAGSQVLLTKAELSGQGDLYLPADDSYIAMARARKLIDEVIPMVEMTPVLVVAKGNPLNIQSLDDVIRRTDVRFGLANPDAAAIGKTVRELLRSEHRWQPLQERILVSKPTVTDIATDLALGTIDATIIWDVLLPLYPKLERVPAPDIEKKKAHVALAILRGSTQQTEALRFAHFLTARDRGLQEFQKHGFRVVHGDLWAETPRLRLLAGTILKPALDETLRAFENREGVTIQTDYDDCDHLVKQMKAGIHPDAYFSCDTSFMTPVRGLFLDAETISTKPQDNHSPAEQAFAIGKDSDFKQLSGRLLEAIRSPESRERFEANGFQWKASQR